MAVYNDIIGGLSNGTGVPSGFTQRFDGLNVTYTVADDSAAPNGKRLNITHDGSTTRRNFISYDAINSDGDRATAQIIALCRINSSTSGTSSSLAGILARGSGDGSAETGYTSVAGRNSGNGQLRGVEYDAGSGTVRYTSAGSIYDQFDIVWLVLEVSGTTADIAMYAENDLFGTPLASDTETIPAANSDNWIGLFSFATATNQDFLWLSVGTGSDSAPVPSDFPVVETASETDTANPITAPASIGAASETDTANAITPTIAININPDIDSSNIDIVETIITDAETSEPTITLKFRSAAITGTNGSGWRHMAVEVINGAGKRPIFKIDRSDMDRNTDAIPATYRPMFTQDRITFTRAPSITLSGGSSGTIDFQFTDPFPVGDIFVSVHPYTRQSDSTDFAEELLTDYSSVAEPTASADVNGVYNTTPIEDDENDRAIGEHPQYGIKLSWPGPTTDGGPKRKLVMISGVHSAGENICWLPFTHAVRWMLDDETEAADDFRSNFDVWIFFNITANGVFGGHRRHNFRVSTDPNRDFINRSLDEIDALTTVVETDVVSADCFLSFHGHNSAGMSTFIPGVLSGGAGSASAADLAFIDLGETIFGVTAANYSASSTGTDLQWGRNVLGATVSLVAEIWQRTDTDPDSYPVIGQNWAKTIQATDAAGYFYEVPEGEVFPTTARSVSSAPDPVVSAGASVFPTTATSVSSSPAPVVSASDDGAVVAPTVARSRGVAYDPLILSGVHLFPDRAVSVSQAPDPVVSIGELRRVQRIIVQGRYVPSLTIQGRI